MRARRSGSASSSSSAPATASTSSGWSTTRPVSPWSTASAAPPLSTGDLRHARRGRLEEHDAEALLLEAGPAVAAQHGVHVAATVEARQVVVAHASDHPHGSARRRDQPVEPSAIAPAPADRDGEIGVPRRELRRRLDQHVHPLAGHQPAEADDQGPVRREPEVLSRRGPLGRRRADGTARCRRRAARARSAATGRPRARPRPAGSPLPRSRARHRGARVAAGGSSRAAGRAP